ncbi:MAG: ABC transporter permease [Thermomicrobiales bacterium]
MIRFLMRRSAQIVLTLLVLITATFLTLRVAPGGPAQVLLGPDQQTPERIAEVNARLGLDQPLPEQLVRWTNTVVHGDLGTSYFYRAPALDIVVERLPATLVLGGGSLLLALLIGIPAGVWAASRRGGAIDRLIRGGAVVVMSTPTFWLGIGLIVVFSAWLGVLPSSGSGAVLGASTIGMRLQHLALRLATMALPIAATFALYTRSELAEVLDADFMRTARAMGLRERQILWGHAFRNAAIPVVMQIGLTLPHVLEGSIIVETVFSWPGVGQLTAASVGRRDYPILLTITLFVGIGVLLSSLFSDLAQRMIDPRVELS